MVVLRVQAVLVARLRGTGNCIRITNVFRIMVECLARTGLRMNELCYAGDRVGSVCTEVDSDTSSCLVSKIQE